MHIRPISRTATASMAFTNIFQAAELLVQILTIVEVVNRVFGLGVGEGKAPNGENGDPNGANGVNGVA